jgi:putative heme-binding domain-containing protein
VGPDLTSIGASAQIDYLVESILLPSKVIKENYHSLVVTTKDDKIITGIKVRESKTELVLRTAEDKEVTIAVEDIDEKKMGSSLMPEGLADPLTRAELVDLVRFLSELGKVGPYAVGQARVVRRWQVLEPTPDVRRLLVQTRIASVTGNDPALAWSSAYSQVAGTLPLDSVPRLVLRPELAPLGVARCQLDVTTGGKVKLVLNSPAGLNLWLGTTPVDLKEQVVLDLPAGVQTLTFAIDRNQRRDPLRCELEDVAGSGARVRVIGGK